MRTCLTKLRLIVEFGAVQKYVKARFEAKPHQWLLSLRSFACSAVPTRTSIWKEGKLTGLTKQEKKGDFAILTRTCRAACYLHHPGAFSTENSNLPAKIGFDTDENGPLKVCQKLAKS